MPIHQTKLTIANPQATGILMPQMPIPFTSRYAIAKWRSITRANATAKPSHHPGDVFLVSVMTLILSVIEPKVCPGPMIGVTADGLGCSAAVSRGCSTGVMLSSSYLGTLPSGARGRYSDPGFQSRWGCAGVGVPTPATVYLGFFNAARYVVRGWVFNSASKP